MKTLIIVLLSLISFNGSAQDNTIKTSVIPVKGNCEECKKRIENAADIKGVKLAVWNEKTQAITVTYKSDKVTVAQIEQAIADRGYDAGNIKGNPAGYNKLPECCKYRDRGHDKK